MLDTLRQDLACAARRLWHAPGYTPTAVLTLALGMGATSATFSVVNAVLLRPLPFPEPERLVAIDSTGVTLAGRGTAARLEGAFRDE